MKIKIFLSILLAAFLLMPPNAFCQENAEVLEVHFLSVGDNDGILLRMGDECAFIDSGNYAEGEFCTEYMKNAGVTKLKYYIGTHAHRDHVGGASVIISKIPTENLLYTYDMTLYCIYSTAKTDEERAMLDATAQHAVNYGDSFTLGGATMTCVGPESYIRKYSFTDNTENHNSLLLHVTYGDTAFFFTGDSPSWKILQMNKNHPEVLRSSVIKAPHHKGGFDESVYELMECQYMVFSTSDIGLPKADQMEPALRECGNVLITAGNRNGHIVFTTDGKTLSVQTQFDYDYTAE